MGTRETYQKVLVQACIIAGDEIALAERIGAPVQDVVDWLLGKRNAPNDYFLRAVDVVLTSQKQHVKDVNTFLEEVRKRHSR